MKYFYITILVISLNVIQASIYSSIKNNVFSLIQKKQGHNEENDAPVQRGSVYLQQRNKEDARDARDAKSAQNKASILKHVRKHEENLNIGRDLPSSKLTESMDKKIGREYFHMDPVLNELKRRSHGHSYRRQGSDSGDDRSSDLDLKFWMDEWDEHWMMKKFEALNSTEPRGDVVNMVVARPWGVPCGDINQLDMPHGTCMLPVECDAEYRIYRGDYFCGRSQYICCALLRTNYDMYGGLDISFGGSSFSTDSAEKNFVGNPKEAKKNKVNKSKNKRKKDRDKRMKEIKKTIKKIIKEIRKILDKSFRNGTTQRKKRTKELKKFIGSLKKQYRKDRKSVVAAHDVDLREIDTNLQNRLDQILGVNNEFMSNDTFRDIVTANGTLNKAKIALLLRTFPDLANLFVGRRVNEDDASSLPLDENEPEDKPEEKPDDKPKDKPKDKRDDKPADKPVLEYDLEFGRLYY